MNIFDQVKSLNLPFGKYAVIGSGVMSAHNIRVHRDVDLLVTKDLYQELKKRGWKTKSIKPDFEVLVFGDFEASPDMVTLENYKPDISRIIQKADVINDVSFSRLTDVIDFKRALGRDKDLTDISLIEEYLKNHVNKRG